MLFYILFALSISCLLLLDFSFRQKSNFFQIVAVILVIFISGLREYVGPDFDDYVRLYQDKTHEDEIEFGFEMVMKLLQSFNLNYNFLFLLFSLLTCLFVYFGIKKHTLNVNIAFLIFLLIPGLYLNSFSIVRQSFSIAVSFYAFHYLLSKNYYKYLLIMAVGFSIHYSCLIAMVIHLIVFKFPNIFNKRNIFIFLLISLVFTQIDLFNLLASIFENLKYAKYFLGESIKVSIVKILVLNTMAFLILINYEKIKNRFPNQKYFMMLYFFSVIFTNIFSSFIFLTRVTYYFRIFEIIVVADLIYLWSKKYRVLLILFFIIYYFGMFVLAIDTEIKAENDDTKLVPYKNVLFI